MHTNDNSRDAFSNGQSERFVRNNARTAIVAAFNALVLEIGYDAVSVGQIVRAARVGRSTFYEHFGSKDDVLRDAVTPLLNLLAQAAGTAPDAECIAMIMHHFAEKRDLALALLSGKSRACVVDALACEIEPFLTAASPAPRALVAAFYAEAQIGFICAWLTQRPHVPAREAAGVLIALARFKQ